MSDTNPTIVIYAALSKASDDPEQTSIATQVEAVKAKLAKEYPDGFTVLRDHLRGVDFFEDDGYSGSKSNRGPGLQRAITAAVDACRETGHVELWANSSARFGRGTSRPGEARALGALFYELRPQGVGLRTVTDDEFVRNEMLVGIGSTIAAKYSTDLSESIKRAKLRDLMAGKHPGGPIPDGYMLSWSTGAGEPVKEITIDPKRAPVVRTIFDLSESGVPDTEIARRMNAEGHQTKTGRPYTRSSVWATLSNPFYAGRVWMRPDGGERIVVDGKHPALIDPDRYDKNQAARSARDYAKPEQKVMGRPNENHVLARLGTCGKCGGRLFAKTSTYVRKDGTKKRSYSCQNAHLGTGLCDASPIDGELVDQAVIAALPDLFPDFDRWQESVATAHESERSRLQREVDRATTDLENAEQVATRVEAEWSKMVASGDKESAKAVLPIVKREQATVTRATTRLTAAQDAIKTITDEPPTNTMLDFALSLQAALRGRIEESDGTIKQINQLLRELFVEFRIHKTADGWKYGDDDTDLNFHPEHNSPSHKTREAVMIVPFAKAGGQHWPYWLSEADNPPPLKWLSTIRDSEPEGISELHTRTV